MYMMVGPKYFNRLQTYFYKKKNYPAKTLQYGTLVKVLISTKSILRGVQKKNAFLHEISLPTNFAI